MTHRMGPAMLLQSTFEQNISHPKLHPPGWKKTPVAHWQLVAMRVRVNVPSKAGMQQAGPGPPTPATVSGKLAGQVAQTVGQSALLAHVLTRLPLAL
jgi:hypothetical protein